METHQPRRCHGNGIEINTKNYKRTRRRRNQPRQQRHGRRSFHHFLLPTALLAYSSHLHPLIKLDLAEATSKNFCGTTWGDASADCPASQPCPLGTDEECTSGGTCWADTACDSGNGIDGMLFDTNNPSHKRFCGSSWNDANENCAMARHCPGGDSGECASGEQCYSFLPDCNFVDMIAESGGGAVEGAASGGGSKPAKLPSEDPSRSQWCGSDWNDAIANCDAADHWCPSGSDGDCPAGKICFAGTDCKYDEDLVPTFTPIIPPSKAPTKSPVQYNLIDNTRFCGNSWTEASENCQIGTHCPSGLSTDCALGQSCFGGISGCNIIDMMQHKDEFGTEIYGMNKLILEEDGEEAVDGGNGTDASSGTQQPQQQQQQQQQQQPGQMPSKAPKPYNAINHIFCGKSYEDAQARCSFETFCANGPLHTCDDEQDMCWSAIEACDASDWLLTSSPTKIPSSLSTSTTMPPVVSPVGTSSPISETLPSSNMPQNSNVPMPTSPPVLAVFTLAPVDASSSTMPSVGTPFIETPDNSNDPIIPTLPPVAQPFTTTDPPVAGDVSSPTSLQVDVDRFTVQQSYCALDYIHLMNECTTIPTCNNNAPCPDGQKCFENVMCAYKDDDPDEINAVTASPTALMPPMAMVPSPPTQAPVVQTVPPLPTLPPINTIITSAPITPRPTSNPTAFTLSQEELADRFANPNNYCGKSQDHVLSSCSYSLQTCNDGNSMCPVGTYCFGGIICPDPSLESATNIPNTAISSSPPTSHPTRLTPPPSSSMDTSNGNDAAVRQNYCAQNMEMIQMTCARAPPCDENNPCPSGTQCFEDVICEAIQNVENQNNAQEGSGETTFVPAPMQLPTSPPTPNPVNSMPIESGGLDCNELCIMPIDSTDCGYALSVGLDNILPCGAKPLDLGVYVGIGDVCTGSGECGTDLELNNCPNNQDIYVRVDTVLCSDFGIGNGGILLPQPSPGDGGDDFNSTDAAGNSAMETVNDNQAVVDTSNETLSKPDDSNISWEELPPVNNGNNSSDNLQGWWLQEKSGAAYGWKKQWQHAFVVQIIALTIISPWMV